MSTPKIADEAFETQKFDPSSPWTSAGHQLQGTPTNIHTQSAAGAALDVTTGFTAFPTTNGNVGYSVQIVLGSGGVATVYTVTGTWDGATQTDTIHATGAGTFEGTKPFDSITRLQSDVDPVGTTDLQTLDLFCARTMRGVYINAAGNVYVRFAEDTNDVKLIVFAGTTLPIAWSRIRCHKSARAGSIGDTTADITVGR